MGQVGKKSMKDIAKLAGVSTSTVSRIINANGRFSEKTKKKVLSIMKKYNYIPNMAAKSLKINKSKSIGIIVTNIQNEFFSEIVSGIEDFFFKVGYSVFICNTSQDSKKEMEYFKVLDSKLVDGIICISALENTPKEFFSNHRKIPMVCIDRIFEPSASDTSYIESDHYQGGFMATEELIKRGCKRILVLAKKRSFSASKKRVEGYKAALKKYKIPIDNKLILKFDGNLFSFDETKKVMDSILEKKVSFDGIFATSDWRAYGALISLKEHNVSIPDDVKIIGFDNVSISKYSYPKITTVNQNREVIIQEASNILFNLMNFPDKVNKKHTIIPVSIIKRETT
ncbi:MAG: LacI family DNA-binding transcriptional regulator [Sebaldella sp.]|nr:LacI family DNA-binding transcriptional regulator [Sebaldella sp.]